MTVNAPRPHADRTAEDPTRPLEPELSLGELLGRLSADFGDLVATHVELAKTEIKEETQRVTRGGAMLAAAAVCALLALMLLSFAAAWGLAEVMATGLAFLVVGVVWAAVAAVVAMRGRRDLAEMRGTPQTKASIKEDVAWAKQQRS